MSVDSENSGLAGPQHLASDKRPHLPDREPKESSAFQQERRTVDLVTVFVFLLLSYWGVVKHYLFQGLEYTSDLVSFVQLSNSWMYGWPLLYENQYGMVSEAHNYYTILAFGPLTKVAGAYGLFAGFLLLLFVAARRGLLVINRRERGWTHRRIVFATLLLGPVGFWIWDHPVYGFHLELLFLPLGILYATSLFERSSWRWCWLSVISLTREEGPILALSLHLLVEFLGKRSGAEGDGIYSTRFLVRFGKLASGYLLLFAAGLGLILAHRGFGYSRLGQAMAQLGAMLEQGRLEENLSFSLLSCVFLMAPALLVALVYCRPTSSVLVLGLALAPMVVVTGIAGLIYDNMTHGMTWPPRFVLIWTVGIVGVLVLLSVPRKPARVPLARWITAAAAFGLLAYQGLSLRILRAYPVWERISTLSTQGLLLSRLTEDEVSFLDCLAASLPEETFIAASGEVFGKFHRHSIVWPDRLESAWRPPEIVVCDEGHRFHLDYLSYHCDQLLQHTIEQGFSVTKVDDIGTSYKPGVEDVVKECVPAGGF